jgi:hypothetical protein
VPERARSSPCKTIYTVDAGVTDTFVREFITVPDRSVRVQLIVLGVIARGGVDSSLKSALIM